ncbi:hypothetical protein KI387_024804, partial [Taxus chinensis]
AAFSPPQPTPPEGPEEVAADRRVMDGKDKTTEAYRLWWVAELQGVRDHPDIAGDIQQRGIVLQRLASAAPNT